MPGFNNWLLFAATVEAFLKRAGDRTWDRMRIDYALRQLVITPMSRDDVLAMRGSGFDLTNDEIEGNWLVEE